MTEEQFLAEFIVLRDQLPRGSKLIRSGIIGWRVPYEDTFWLRRNGTLTREECVTGADGRRRGREVPVTSEHDRIKALEIIHRELQRTRDAISQGADTRKRRHEEQLKKVTDAWLRGDGARYANRDDCGCCRKLLTDPESRTRGIGPECWEHIVRRIEAARAKQPEAIS